MAKAQQNAVVAQQETNVVTLQVFGVTPLRAQRIAAVKQALFMRHIAAKHVRYNQATVAHEQAVAKQQQLEQYKQQLAALQQQYGITSAKATSSTGATKQPKPGTTCYQVWQLAKAHGFIRAATLAACEAAGINKATAATQYALANRAQGTY